MSQDKGRQEEDRVLRPKEERRGLNEGEKVGADCGRKNSAARLEKRKNKIRKGEG